MKRLSIRSHGVFDKKNEDRIRYSIYRPEGRVLDGFRSEGALSYSVSEEKNREKGTMLHSPYEIQAVDIAFVDHISPKWSNYKTCVAQIS